MTRPSRDGWSSPITVFTAAFASLIALSTAHQSISYPTPISYDLACRVGLGRNCPGPCPNYLLRKDQTPNSPSVTVRRDGVLPVHVLKNNHVGGFSRWSLVKVSDMHSKKKHAESSFLYTCADVQVTQCTSKNQERDCKVDRLNQYYKHYIRIPKIYPDRYYVLGWIWYGGLVSTGTHGAFGDYYDCVYIRVKGGPLENSHRPIFKPGKATTGRDGRCSATTNRVGHCYREPCPFGNRHATLMKPEEFEGKEPNKILRKNFEVHTDQTTASNIKQKGHSNSSDYKTKQPTSAALPKPTSKSAKPTSKPAKPTYKPAKPMHKPAKPTSKPAKPTYKPAKPMHKPAKPASKPANPTSKPAKPTHKPAKPAHKPAKPTYKPAASPSSNNYKALKPTATPVPQSQEKLLRKKANLRKRREKQRRKAEAKKAKLEAKKAKLEAKRLRKEKIKKAKAIKKAKLRREKQRRKEEARARKLAKKRAMKEAKLARKRAMKEAKQSGKRSFARPPSAGESTEYDDCFEEGIFPDDDGHIDYGDPFVEPHSRN